MPVDTANLMGEIYDLFSKLYAAKTNSQDFLAFEVLGIPMSDGMFKLPGDPAYCPPLAIEHVSDLANTGAHVQGGSVIRGLGTVDGAMELLIVASAAPTADDMTSLGAAKLSAKTHFSITLGYMDGVADHRFHPVYASPTDWYVSTANSNWVSHTSSQTQGKTAPPPPRPVPPIAWRVLPAQLQPTLSQPVSAAHPLLNSAAISRVAAASPKLMTMSDASPSVSKTSMAATAVAPALATATISPVLTKGQATPVASPIIKQSRQIRSSDLMLAVSDLNAVAVTQSVTTNSLDLSFDHCVVTMNRPWLPETLLLMRNWYVPGYAKGDISNGTGSGDPGRLPIVTTGFVAIRNLRIKSNWSQQDLTAIQTSAAFGPFSLIGRTYDAATGTLTCPGIQVIGWFCSALPVLPPLSDPAKK